MAQRYGPDVIERVREANDIVAVVSEHVRLQRAGHTLKGLCPFHSEKTPSFMVSPDKQLFYCFGCAAGGNVINFVMRLENLTFPEALESLARRAGIELPAASEESPESRARREERERLLAVIELATRFYHQVLLKTKAGQPGLAYLRGRGTSDATIQRFHLGFAPDRWDGLARFLTQRGASLADAASAGLLSPRKRGGGYFDRFRNRVMFPILDREGRPIAFGGRVLGKGDEPKYLNSPETALFHKGQTLFGLNVAKEAIRKAGHALIVEGYMDAVMAHQSGFTQAVASLGTSLTPGQARLLARFASEARIAYDADTAGQAATWRGLGILTEAGFRVRVVRLPAGADPDSFIRASGPDAFREAIAEAQALNAFKIESTLAGFDLEDAEGRVAAAAAIVPLLAGIPGLVERAEYQKQAALKLGVPIEALEAEVNAAEKRQHSLERNIFPGANNNRADVELGRDGAKDRSVIPVMERELVRMLLVHAELLEPFQDTVGLTTITDLSLREIAAAMIEARQEGVEISPATLSTRLGGEEVAQCLSELVLQKEDHLSGIEPGDLLRQFARHSLSRVALDLGRRVESASTAGDLAALNRLVLEYKSLRDRDRQAFPTL